MTRDEIEKEFESFKIPKSYSRVGDGNISFIAHDYAYRCIIAFAEHILRVAKHNCQCSGCLKEFESQYHKQPEASEVKS